MDLSVNPCKRYALPARRGYLPQLQAGYSWGRSARRYKFRHRPVTIASKLIRASGRSAPPHSEQSRLWDI